MDFMKLAKNWSDKKIENTCLNNLDVYTALNSNHESIKKILGERTKVLKKTFSRFSKKILCPNQMLIIRNLWLMTQKPIPTQP